MFGMHMGTSLSLSPSMSVHEVAWDKLWTCHLLGAHFLQRHAGFLCYAQFLGRVSLGTLECGAAWVSFFLPTSMGATLNMNLYILKSQVRTQQEGLL